MTGNGFAAAGARAGRMMVAAALLGLTAVAAGAFGAHLLAEQLDTRLSEIFQTATRYQAMHATALAVVALARRSAGNEAWLDRAAWCFGIGTVIFSGTLYGIVAGGPNWLGAITPIGGIGLMLGWASLAAWGWSTVRPS